MKSKHKLLIILLIFIFTCNACQKKPSAESEGTPETTSSPSESTVSPEADQDPRTIILSAEPDNELRIQYLTEDIEFFREQLPQNHMNLFHNITEEEFNQAIDSLIADLANLSSFQVFTEMNKIVSAVGDAHTDINYWDGKIFPLSFYLFEDDFYVINGELGLEDYLFKKVTAINQIPIAEIKTQLSQLVSYENESWLAANLANYLNIPIYLEGLSLIPGTSPVTFTFADEEGNTFDGEIPVRHTSDRRELILTYAEESNKNAYQASQEDYYWFEYQPASGILYFKYNACMEMETLSFTDFNEALFQEIYNNDTKALVIDLRYNTGGNSEIIQPFIAAMAEFHQANPDIPVYTAIGRQTFSSGIFAIYYIKRAVPDAILIGEPTGGSPNSYGEVQYFLLPHMELPVTYSVNYFGLGFEDADTITPDIPIHPAVQDFEQNQDAVIKYIETQIK